MHACSRAGGGGGGDGPSGVSGDERAFTPARESLRKRLPWLAVNLGTAFVASAVVGLFARQGGVLDTRAYLAALMPIVAGMGGNAGTQTLTVIVRGIALGELRERGLLAPA